MDRKPPPPFPRRPVALRPGERLTFSLAGGRRCGVRRAPWSLSWSALRKAYLDPDETLTVVGSAGRPTLVLFQVDYFPHAGDTPPLVTVWVRGFGGYRTH
jgi:hypothetical protein